MKLHGIQKACWGLLVIVPLLVLHIRLQNYIYDDAYITIRIASHLIGYGQPYFNLGEKVNVSSTTVWTLLVAAALLMGKSRLVSICILNAAISTCGMIAFIDLLGSERKLSTPGKLIAGAAYLAITLPTSIGLMETPLALLVISLALLRYERRRADAFVLLGLAPFIRLECAALYGIVAFHAILRKRFPISRIVLYSLLGVVPFLAYEAYFFGTVVPNTVIAKTIVYDLSYRDVLMTFVSSLIPGLVLWSQAPFLLPMVPALTFALGMLLLVDYLLHPNPGTVPFLPVALAAFGCTVVMGYVFGRALIFPWYRPLYLVPLLAALVLSQRRSASRPMTISKIVLATPILCLWMAALVQIGASTFRPSLEPDFPENARTRTYLQIGRALYEKYPQARLMASEIGALGYAFPGSILDGAGLATPVALRYHPLQIPAQRSRGTRAAIPSNYIEDAKPEIIVSMDIFLEDFIHRGDATDYVLFQVPIYVAEDAAYVDQTLWGSTSISVYIRRDVLAAAPFPRSAR